MAHTNLSHRRTHNLLLISKLLNQQQQQTSHRSEDASVAANLTAASSSPFTLILDTLEETARALIIEYMRRAKVKQLAKIKVIYLGFETARSSFPTKDQSIEIEAFVSCYDKTPEQIASAVTAARTNSSAKRSLIIIDSVHTLCTLSQNADPPLNLAAYLFSLIGPLSTSQSSQTSLVTVYHTDIPLPGPPTHSHQQSTYSPSPLSLLKYLATTIFTIHSLSTLLAARIAQERSQAATRYGLSEEREGIVIGLKPSKFSKEGFTLRSEERGIVLELEHRRKSGRGVREWYFLPFPTSRSSSTIDTAPAKRNTQPRTKWTTTTTTTTTSSSSPTVAVTLLDDHPQFRRNKQGSQAEVSSASQNPDLNDGMTFELKLTDRQKLERDGVVLPYFDAQREGSGGDGHNNLTGGRILYDMGSEDDFDEEEDEI